MRIEKPYLRNGSGAYETSTVVELRTSLHAAATRNTAGERIGGFLILHRQAWTGTQIIGTVNWHPCLHSLQILKQDASIDREVSNNGKLGEGFEADGLVKLVD